MPCLKRRFAGDHNRSRFRSDFSRERKGVLQLHAGIGSVHASERRRRDPQYGLDCGSRRHLRPICVFVDGYLKNNYPGREQEMFEKLSKSQPIGRMAEPEEVASLALFLCSDEASFITGVDYPLDGGFCNLRG